MSKKLIALWASILVNNPYAAWWRRYLKETQK